MQAGTDREFRRLLAWQYVQEGISEAERYANEGGVILPSFTEVFVREGERVMAEQDRS